mgnify:CR=1 FL=1
MKIKDESYINFKKNVEQFVIRLNQELISCAHAHEDGDYDSTINSVARVCSRELSLVLDEKDLLDNHENYEQQDPLYYGKVPRCHFIFPKNDTMLACVTNVTDGFVDTFGGYVGYIPNNWSNVPLFFLESISDKDYTHTYYQVSPLETHNRNIWYDRK